MKKINLVAGIFVLLGVVPRGHSLTCLQCNAVTHPRHCRHVVQCSPGEVCFVETITTEFGQHLFSNGCTSASKCSNTTFGSGGCQQCCTTDLCNSHGCGESGYPDDRGLVCYHCPAPVDIGTCQMIEFCQPDEVCYYTVREEFGEFAYSGGCAREHLCEMSGIFGNVIVGRDLEQNEDAALPSQGNEICEGCCTYDLCNTDCNATYNICEKMSPCVRGRCVATRNNFTCICPAGTTGRRCENVPSTDCYDIQNMGFGMVDGVYVIQLWRSKRNVTVYCDLTTDGGGWTVFQNRFNGTVDFYRNFANYTYGFGDPSTEFWLGLDYVHELTIKRPTELRLDLTAPNGTRGYEVFRNFNVSQGPGYNLHIDFGTGTVGDDYRYGLSYSLGMAFSTFDHDNDTDSGNCAFTYKGAWWYKACMETNLNSLYLNPGTRSGSSMFYYTFTNGEYSLKTSKMMLRPKF